MAEAIAGILEKQFKPNDEPQDHDFTTDATRIVGDYLEGPNGLRQRRVCFDKPVKCVVGQQQTVSVQEESKVQERPETPPDVSPSSPLTPLAPLIPQSSEKVAAYLLDKEGDRENKERSQGIQTPPDVSPSSPLTPLAPLIPQSSEKVAAYLLDKEGDRENKERSQECSAEQVCLFLRSHPEVLEKFVLEEVELEHLEQWMILRTQQPKNNSDATAIKGSFVDKATVTLDARLRK
uniref:Uncharacterized protein n=1 Tax=Timema monikensis TaxID=170555 RepID=A0A7R9HRB5_9NEOP|nr:unnamed protein product [Timema monikensis]